MHIDREKLRRSPSLPSAEPLCVHLCVRRTRHAGNETRRNDEDDGMILCLGVTKECVYLSLHPRKQRREARQVRLVGYKSVQYPAGPPEAA